MISGMQHGSVALDRVPRSTWARVRALAFAAAVMVLIDACAGSTGPGWTALPPASLAVASQQPTIPPSPTPETTPLASATGAASPAGGSIEPSAGTAGLLVVARDLSFTPRELTASAGGQVTVELQNSGRLTHNLTVDELGLKLIVSPGKTKSLTIPAPAPGTYTFYCSVSGHRQAGMFGTLTVK